MKTVMEAARAIRAEDAELIVCGGAESMSRAAYASNQTRFGARMGDVTMIDTMIRDGLWDAYNDYHMGTTAENVCDLWGITRQELDAFAAASQQKLSLIHISFQTHMISRMPTEMRVGFSMGITTMK